jgi:hypothetical protein
MNFADGTKDGVRVEVLGIITQPVPCAQPATITSQPQSQMAFIGQSAVFSVAASSAPSPCAQSCQWLFNGPYKAGATNFSITITNAQLADAGTYSAVVMNASGSVTSSPAILQVLPTNAPSTRINGQLAAGTVYVNGPAQLTFSGGFSGGSIFYTLDGTTPSTSSPLYNGAVTLTNSGVVKAMSLSADFSQSAYAPAVTVQIPTVFSLQVSVSGSGSVSLNPSGGIYASNSVVTLTATPSDCSWFFDHWTGDLSGNQNPANLTMNAPRNVQAVFVPLYPLIVDWCRGTNLDACGGTVGVTGPGQPWCYQYALGYPSNSTVTLTATPSNGWTFLHWQGTVNSTNNPFNLTMTQTVSIQGVFGTAVFTNVTGAGSIALSPANPVPSGAVVTATANPSPGSYFRLWSGALSGTNNPASFTVATATPTVDALFAPVPAGDGTLNVVVNGNGTVSVSPQQPYYSLGQTVTLTASTNGGSSFSGWGGDASGNSNPLSLLLDTNKVVIANFGFVPAGMTMGMCASINISGTAGSSYIIQGTYNLRDTNAWVTLTNLTLQQDQELWVDTSTNALRAGARFYRILPGP